MTSKLEGELTCPVCTEIFRDPVLLTCTHSICRVCVQKFWETKPLRECPICRRESSTESPPLNRVLKNMCELYLQERSHKGSVCDIHGDTLRLFCHDDQVLVCFSCRDSKLHKNHDFSLITEESEDRRERLKLTLDSIKEKLKAFERAKATMDDSAKHIKAQIQSTEKQIKQEFRELYQFLREEEAIKICALKREERQKTQMIMEHTEKINREISSLTDTIRAIKAQIREDDVTLLQNYHSTVLSSQYPLQDPDDLSGALINVAKHLGNLKFTIWRKMQKIVQYTPVILDPNTASDGLILSEHLNCVTCHDEKQQLPDNPERFDHFTNVMGSESFFSGNHSWTVEVGENTKWQVGVMTESHQRKGNYSSNSGRWFVWYDDGRYKARSPPKPSVLLTVKKKLKRIKVQLDLDGGKVSFYNPDNSTHLHTFTHAFTERVLPYFAIGCELSPLYVLSAKVVIEVE